MREFFFGLLLFSDFCWNREISYQGALRAFFPGVKLVNCFWGDKGKEPGRLCRSPRGNFDSGHRWGWWEAPEAKSGRILKSLPVQLSQRAARCFWTPSEMRLHWNGVSNPQSTKKIWGGMLPPSEMLLTSRKERPRSLYSVLCDSL